MFIKLVSNSLQLAIGTIFDRNRRQTARRRRGFLISFNASQYLFFPIYLFDIFAVITIEKVVFICFLKKQYPTAVSKAAAVSSAEVLEFLLTKVEKVSFPDKVLLLSPWQHAPYAPCAPPS